MSGDTFNDAFMLEIFRSEVETHVESLTSGLLALERDPGDASHIDEMMRGAHSIKGAARIVGIDPAVRVAHVMEDGFVAAKNGKLNLNPTHVDTLLRGVDMLNRIAAGSKDSHFDCATFNDEAIPLVAEITAVFGGASLPVEAESTASAASISDAPLPALDSMREQGSAANHILIVLPAFLDAANAELARREFIAGLYSGASLVRFDLTKTTDLDSTGLAFLAAVPVHAKSGATRVELFGAMENLQRVLEVTGVHRLYPAGAN